MKKNQFFLFFFISLSCLGQAADSIPENEDFWNKVYYGGDIQLQFGNVSIINISPIIGYKLTENGSIGFGPVYERYSFSGFITNVYGGRLIAKQIISQAFIVQAEYEDLVIKTGFNKSRLQRFLVGGGYREHLGGKVYAQLIFLWDVTHNSRSYNTIPYVIRGGITVGL